MVLIIPTKQKYSGPSHGLSALNTLQTAFWINSIKLCKACLNRMAAIPPSAFSAARIRETQRDTKMANVKKNGDTNGLFFNTKIMELSPLKYNSKLMNSIWGFYNRYSPHNVKKVSEAPACSGEMQYPAVISSGKSEPVLSLPPKFDTVWAAMNASQSH